MAVLEQGLVSYLSNYAGVNALVSTRVYDSHIPQSATLPCLTVQRISTPRALTMDTSGSGGALAHPRFQFDAWATTYGAAKSITEQVRAALQSKSGSVGGSGSSVTIRCALVDEEAPEYSPETHLYRSRSDFIIWHEE